MADPDLPLLAKKQAGFAQNLRINEKNEAKFVADTEMWKRD
jgi:hypothetical protein